MLSEGGEINHFLQRLRFGVFGRHKNVCKWPLDADLRVPIENPDSASEL